MKKTSFLAILLAAFNEEQSRIFAGYSKGKFTACQFLYELGLTDHDILRIGSAFYALYGQQAGWWQCHEFWQE